MGIGACRDRHRRDRRRRRGCDAGAGRQRQGCYGGKADKKFQSRQCTHERSFLAITSERIGLKT